MRVALLLLLISYSSGCPTTGPVNPPTDTNFCPAAEAHLLELQCKDSRGRLLGGPNLHGVKFRDVCVDQQNNGVHLNPTCLSAVKSCEEIDACLQAQ